MIEPASVILLGFYRYVIFPMYNLLESIDVYALIILGFMAFFLFVLLVFSVDGFYIWDKYRKEK